MTWSSPLTNRFLLEAGGTLAANDFVRLPQPEVVPGVSPITELSTNFSYRANPTAPYGHNRSNNYNYRASALVRHRVALASRSVSSSRTPGPGPPPNRTVPSVSRCATACRCRCVQWGTPISYLEKIKYNIGLYAQDRWTVNRATINLGVRADFFNAFVEPQSLPAGPFVPAREFPGVYDVPNWKDVSPRLGVSYDVFGDGKTAIKANLGRLPAAVRCPRTSPASPIR